jgi:signal peptidase I
MTDQEPEAEPRRDRTARRPGLGGAFEVAETLVLTLVIYLVAHNFVAQPFEVQMVSMSPTILDGEYILIDKLTPHFDDYTYGDVVVFEPPTRAPSGGGGIPFIKRIIGLPGDTITLENGRVFITGPGGLPIRIEESYVARGPHGASAPTLCPQPTCSAEWLVPDGSYFVMGDNRERSQDSRVLGPIDEDLILGRAWLRYFPIDRVGLINDSGVVRAFEPLADE